jgi:hypothetical protein
VEIFAVRGYSTHTVTCGYRGGYGLRALPDPLALAARSQRVARCACFFRVERWRGGLLDARLPCCTHRVRRCFGEKDSDEEFSEADVLSAVEFDTTGNYLATGDKGGRIVVFERASVSRVRVLLHR